MYALEVAALSKALWSVRLAFALIAAASAASPGTASAEPVNSLLCSLEPFGAPPDTSRTFFLGTALPDTVAVHSAPARLRLPRGELAEPVWGQEIRVERIAGPGARAIKAGDVVVVIPWGYGADCRTERWWGSAHFAEPGQTGLYRITLRERELWMGGRPTFDAKYANFEPYPHASGYRRFERSDGRASRVFDPDYALTPEQLFEVFQRVAGEDVTRTRNALLEWAETRPDLASRYPMPEMLWYARSDARRETRGPVAPDGGETCDGDFDGAFLGAIVGAVPGLLVSLDAPPEHGNGGPLLMLAGAIVGFWGGLAYDSMDCDEAGRP